MADSGNEAEPFEGGNEPFYDYPCSLCEKEGKHEKAVRYCEECFVYMCDPCVRNHNRFPLNTSHQLLDQSQFVTLAKSRLVSFPTKRCLKHPGELINIYCEDDDVVCCSSCKVLEHRHCENTHYLTDAAKGIQESGEYQCIKNDMSLLLTDVVRVRSDRKAFISSICDEKGKVQKIIADFRNKVNKCFDVMEKQTLDELDQKAKQIASGCEQDIKELAVTQTKAEDILKQLESFKGDNECDLFVQVKTGKQFLHTAAEKILQYSKAVQVPEINFRTDPIIEEFLCSVQSLGTFSDSSVDTNPFTKVLEDKHGVKSAVDDSDLLHKYKTQLYAKVYMVEKSDSEVCDITDACQLPDGTILIVDCNNMKLKRLGKLYEVTESLQFAQSPVSVCYLGFLEVAVSMCADKKVQCISVGKEMTLTRSFSTGCFCRGMVYVHGNLYICCGNLGVLSSGCIEVYNSAGKLQRSISRAGRGLSRIPWRITSTHDGQNLLVTSYGSNDISLLDLDGNEVNVFRENNLRGPDGICSYKKSQVLVCGFDSNTVVQLSPKHLKIQDLMTEEDGIKSPVMICYDRRQSKLLISSFRSNYLLVFSID